MKRHAFQFACQFGIRCNTRLLKFSLILVLEYCIYLEHYKLLEFILGHDIYYFFLGAPALDPDLEKLHKTLHNIHS